MLGSKWFSILTLAVLSPSVSAQKVTIPAEIRGLPSIPMTIVAEADGDNVTWLAPDPRLVVIDGGFFHGDSKRAVLFAPAGKYTLWALTAKDSKISPKAECTVIVGDVPPGPTPVPPGPDPGPNPPTPVKGVKVLIVRETAAKLSKEHSLLLNSSTFYDHLRKVTPAENGLRQFKVWDPQQDVENETPDWKKIWEATKPKLSADKLPVIIVIDGAGVAQMYPLPTTEAATIEILAQNGLK